MASIDKRPNGTYRARWREYPRGPQKSKQFARKVDATAFLTSVQHNILSGTYVAPEAGKVTLNDYAAVYLARGNWRPSTLATARASLAHALRVLGDRPLSTIRKGDVQALLSGLQLAPGSVRIVQQHLGATFAAAVDDGLLVRSPAAGVKSPRTEGGEIVPPTSEQVAALLVAAPPWFRKAIVLGAGLGLRQAEASGLTVDRVNWLGRTVRVDRQYVTKQHPWGFAPPKTAASIRSIPAARTVIEELSRDVSTEGASFVVHLDDGSPVDHNRWGGAWRRTCVEAGVEGVRYHDLRHHFASALISKGCSVKAVQKALGHSSASTTLNVYAHLWPGDEDRIRAAVDEAFGPAEDWLRTAEDG